MRSVFFACIISGKIRPGEYTFTGEVAMRSVQSISVFLWCFSGCWLALAPVLQGATRTAASLSPADVQAAVDAADDGDTVKLPAETATWTACVKIDGKCITVEVQGPTRRRSSSGLSPPNRRFTCSRSMRRRAA